MGVKYTFPFAPQWRLRNGRIEPCEPGERCRHVSPRLQIVNGTLIRLL
jgi:hypothetical protein